METVVADGAGLDGPTVSLLGLTTEDEGCSGFAQIESRALQVEGPAGVFGDGLQRLEARHGEGVLHVGTTDDGHVVTIGLQQARSQDEGCHARDAGIADHQGRGADTYRIGNMLCCGGGGDVGGRLYALAQELYIPLCGAEDEHDPRLRDIEISLRQRITDGSDGERLETCQALV